MSKVITVQYVGDDINSDLRYAVMRPSAEDSTHLQEAVKEIKAHRNGYFAVAEVEFDDRLSVEDNLEHAYKLMQNGVVTDSWTLMPPDGLKPLLAPIKHHGQDYGHRSASMGDIFVVDGKEYVVATFGFEEVK